MFLILRSLCKKNNKQTIFFSQNNMINFVLFLKLNVKNKIAIFESILKLEKFPNKGIKK